MWKRHESKLVRFEANPTTVEEGMGAFFKWPSAIAYFEILQIKVMQAYGKT